jgi:hypothetical protein
MIWKRNGEQDRWRGERLFYIYKERKVKDNNKKLLINYRKKRKQCKCGGRCLFCRRFLRALTWNLIFIYLIINIIKLF